MVSLLTFPHCTHLALRLQVAFVPHQEEDDAVRLDVAASLLQPIVDVLEGSAVGDVEQEEPTHRVTVVSPGDGPAEGVNIYQKIKKQLFSFFTKVEVAQC